MSLAVSTRLLTPDFVPLLMGRPGFGGEFGAPAPAWRPRRRAAR